MPPSKPLLPIALDEAVRAALAVVRATLPAEHEMIVAYVEAVEYRAETLLEPRKFEAFLYDRILRDGRTDAFIEQLMNGPLTGLAAAEADRQERMLLEAKDRQERVLTWRQTLTQPVVLAVISAISTAIAGLFALLRWVVDTAQ
tara:strand:- start:447 stop:878 length:432 start_codon:yes stop_codon:yes gene_type:complete